MKEITLNIMCIIILLSITVTYYFTDKERESSPARDISMPCSSDASMASYDEFATVPRKG